MIRSTRLAPGDEPEVYHFADLRLDVGRQRLTRGGTDIPLPKLSFDVLLALVHAAPNVVSIQELMDRVWPGVVVNPETVTQRVKLLRDAIGDDPREPHYVAGLRGRGYQLACDLSEPSRTQAGEPEDGSTGTGIAPPGVSTTTVAAHDLRILRHRPLIALVVAAVLAALAIWAGLRLVGVGQPAPEATTPGTIAVLPFDDLSSDGSADYIALGVPEMILNRLSAVPGLTVIARSSSFDPEAAAAGKAKLAERLEARFLVDGSVQRQGEALRITASLVDPVRGVQLWSENFDRRMPDLFAVQEEIADRTVRALRAHLDGVAELPPRARLTSNLDAYLLYLQGRALLGRWTVVDAEQAAGLFQQAIALEPTFAAAYASLYDAKMMAADRRRADLGQARQANRPLIERALQLDAGAGAAYFARAIWERGDDPQREADFRKGIELDPSNGRGLIEYSEFLGRAGRREEETRMLERAGEVDPLSPRVQFRLAVRGFGYVDMTEVEALMKRVLERDPNYQPALQRYAKYRWILHGNLAEAARIIEHAVAVDPENPWSRYTAAAIYLDLGDQAAARDVAAGTPQSAATSRALLALDSGDVEQAGRSALSGETGANSRYERWGEGEAVRDYALATGELDRSIHFFEDRFSLHDSAALDIGNFRAAACLAQLLGTAGQTARSTRLLEDLLAAIDASIPTYGTVYALRTRAQAQLLQGNSEAALATLAESFRSQDYTQWWYTLRHDPLWLALKEDPRFGAIEAAVNVHVAGERKALDQLRLAGEIPLRPGPMTTLPASAATDR